jgi:hypothetical protein
MLLFAAFALAPVSPVDAAGKGRAAQPAARAGERSRFERKDVTRSRERLDRRLGEARWRSRSAGPGQKLAWRLGRAFWKRPTVALRVAADLTPLTRLTSPVSIRKRVIAAMEIELDRVLGELLPLVNPELQDRYAHVFSDHFARLYLSEQRQVAIEMIHARQGELSDLDGDEQAIRREIDSLAARRHQTVVAAAAQPGHDREVALNVARHLARREERAAARLARVEVARRTAEKALAGLERVQGALAVEPVGGVLPIGSEHAGKVFNFKPTERGKALRRRYPAGVRFTEAGFPDFSPYALVSLRGELSASRDVDFSRANAALYRMLTRKTLFIKSGMRKRIDRQLGVAATRALLADLARGKTPAGYTWHHHEDVEIVSAATARWRGVDFLEKKGLRRTLVLGDLLLVPSDLHAGVSHHGGVSRSKYLRPPAQFGEIRWTFERVSEP